VGTCVAGFYELSSFVRCYSTFARLDRT